MTHDKRTQRQPVLHAPKESLFSDESALSRQQVWGLSDIDTYKPTTDKGERFADDLLTGKCDWDQERATMENKKRIQKAIDDASNNTDFVMPRDDTWAAWERELPSVVDDDGQVRTFIKNYCGYSAFIYESIPNEEKAPTAQAIMFLMLQVPDIPPEECTQDQPVHTMRNILSHLKTPYDYEHDPCRQCKPDLEFEDGFAVWNPVSQPLKMTQAFEKAVASLDEHVDFSNVRAGTIEIVSYGDWKDLIGEASNFFDKNISNKSGHNWKNGVEPLWVYQLMENRSGRKPLRLMLSAVYHPQASWNDAIQNYTTRVCTYSLDCVYPACFNSRLCTDGKLEAVMELGEAAWRLTRHFMYENDCISYVCPPNGCQTVAYLGNEFEISPHRDMGVGAKAKRNGETSTCIGSAVLVVSIGCDQIFSFLKNAGNRDAKARYSHENLARGNDGKYLSFMMKHGSIYVMLPKADQSHYHHCYFPRDNTTDVSTHRVALTFRWLCQNGEACVDPNTPLGRARIIPNIIEHFQENMSNGNGKVLIDLVEDHYKGIPDETFERLREHLEFGRRKDSRKK